jgi:type 1 glutamine amidotransferase
MEAKMHIRFQVGGPAVHPTHEQAMQIGQWLGPDYRVSICQDSAAFEALDDVDVLVLMGMFWPGMDADWAGNMTYDPIKADAQANFLRYTRSQRPLLIHHGAIGCYTDWPEFGATLGVTWGVKRASHSPFVRHQIRVAAEPHPITAGVDDFAIDDELYHSLRIDESRNPNHLLWGSWEGAEHPLLTTLDASARSGKTVFSALGHNLQSFEPPAMRQLWRNSITWLTQH